MKNILISIQHEELETIPSAVVCPACYDDDTIENHFEEILEGNEYLRENNTMICFYECDANEESTDEECDICNAKDE